LFTVKVCEKRHILRERKGQYIRREKEVLNLLSLNHKPSVPFFVKLQCTFQDVERLCILVLHIVGTFPKESCKNARNFVMSVLILAKSHSRTNEQIFMKFFTVEFY
jgi:hypothetical protein